MFRPYPAVLVASVIRTFPAILALEDPGASVATSTRWIQSAAAGVPRFGGLLPLSGTKTPISLVAWLTPSVHKAIHRNVLPTSSCAPLAVPPGQKYYFRVGSILIFGSRRHQSL